MKTFEKALCPKCGGELQLSYKEEELVCPSCQVKLVTMLNKKGHRVIRAAESRIKPKAERTAPAAARPRANPAQRAAAIQRVLFSIVALIIVLSMILALFAM